MKTSRGEVGVRRTLWDTGTVVKGTSIKPQGRVAYQQPNTRQARRNKRDKRGDHPQGYVETRSLKTNGCAEKTLLVRKGKKN